MEGGLLRVGGRLKGSTLGVEQRHPVILPKDGHVTKLILSHFHSHVCHQGRNQTLTELRAQGFWIIGGSKTIGRFVHKCVQCRRQRRPVEEQKIADLPEERCEISVPFTF